MNHLERLLAAALWMQARGIERLDREPHHVYIARLRAALEAA